MTGLLFALIVVAAFGLLFWILEANDWSRMRHGHLPRPSMGAVGPWMRDVLHLPADERGKDAHITESEALTPPQEAAIPPPQRAPDPPPPPERSVEDSVYDRLYGGRRSVRAKDRDD